MNRAILASAALATLVGAGATGPTPPVTPLAVATPNVEVEVLKAQTAEMRRSEDRILQTVLWSLAAVGTLAVGLAAFSWYQSSRVYQRDLEKMREQIRDELHKEIKTRFAVGLKQELLTAQNEQLTKHVSTVEAYPLPFIAELFLAMKDPDSAIRVGLELYGQAKRGNPNYVAHALDKLADACELAYRKQIAIPKDRWLTLKGMTRQLDEANDPRSKRFAELVELVPRSEKVPPSEFFDDEAH